MVCSLAKEVYQTCWLEARAKIKILEKIKWEDLSVTEGVDEARDLKRGKGSK